MSDQYDSALRRLICADDDKLGPILAKLLPLVFDELLSQTDSTLRAKLVNILNHVLTRAKGNTAINLPAQSILERWFAPGLATSPNGPFFRNLSIIFLDVGIPRLQPQEQIDLALYSLENFGKLLPGLDRIVVFLSCIPGLGQISELRKEQVTRCLALLKSSSYDSVAAFFQSAVEFLLIPCGATEAASVGGLPSASWSHWKSRLKSKAAAEMVGLKCTVLRWLSSLGAEPPAFLVYLPSLVASVENYDAVSNMAESNCKRLDLELDMDNDLDLLGRLICLGLTSAPPGQEDASGPLKVETKVSVPAKLRHKVLVLLQRSRGIGPSLVAHVVHLIRQSLRENEQVQQSALQLALVLSETVDPENLVETSEKILAEVEAVFWPGGGVIAMGTATPLAFKTFGSFARQLAERPSGQGRALALQSAPKMLSLLAANDAAAQDILEALSGLVACLRGSEERERQDFLPLLDKLVTAPRAVVRREVLRWSSALFPTSSPEGRYYALRLVGDKASSITRSRVFVSSWRT
ncbi:Proteasome adapter and scaffold protein ECM29 (Proteasome-associated protein ECM29 homolog) [Durusdinium trenchii]|uniref:Proteasome adapter and scaffold protein ECM29 (Proteasome-associated protein ECM29 homolog) n=1 Tax=Durusdinium trenchii TaxID=1381693 RepID=A0ABP0L284_9DINO